MLERLELPRVTLYGARHSYATEGVQMKAVQEMLGHSSITVTSDIHSHVAPAFKRQAADALETHLAHAREGNGGGVA